jgi:hypothetical protein
VKHIPAIDNPLNGFVDGHSGGDDLGMFILSPGTLKMRNQPPGKKSRYFWLMMENRFYADGPEFYDPAK